MFLNTCKAAGVKTADLRGGVLYDPVGKAVMKGSLCGGKGICAYYDQMAVMTKWGRRQRSRLPDHRRQRAALRGFRRFRF